MEVSSSTVSQDSKSAAIILQDELSTDQISTIQSTLDYFSTFLDGEKKLDENAAQDMWIDDIKKITSRRSEKVLKKLQELVHRNYVENFALEKAVVDPPLLEEGSMFARLNSLIKKYSGTLKDCISLVTEEILQILPQSQKQSVKKEAFEMQNAQKTDIQQFVKKIELYQKQRRANGGFFAFIGLGFVVSLFTPNHEDQPSFKVHEGQEYTNLELKKKKQI